MTDLKRRTATVVLFQGDDEERIDELADQANAAIARQGGARTLDEGDELADAAKAYDDFVREATERAMKVQLVALRNRHWRNLVDEHPQRIVKVKQTRADDDAEEVEVEVEVAHDADAPYGFNVTTMADALPALSIAEGQFSGPGAVSDFIEELSAPHFGRIYSTAIAINRAGGSIPKADLLSRLKQMSDET